MKYQGELGLPLILESVQQIFSFTLYLASFTKYLLGTWITQRRISILKLIGESLSLGRFYLTLHTVAVSRLANLADGSTWAALALHAGTLPSPWPGQRCVHWVKSIRQLGSWLEWLTTEIDGGLGSG
jgi:hypothetical protein